MLNFRKHARVNSKYMSAAFRQYILLSRNLHECKVTIMEILKRSTVRKVATFFMNENCGTLSNVPLSICKVNNAVH